MAIHYTKGEEWANALSHGVGIIIGIVGGGYLLWIATQSGNPWAIFGMVLYLFGMLASYLTSTWYHSLKPSSPHKELFRKFDHASIYLHIAGSYSPIVLVTLREVGFWGWGIFIFVWLCAVIGVTLSFRKLKEHSNLETICFIAMGCTIFVVFKTFCQLVPAPAIYWLLAEGGSYVLGAAFYTWHKLPYMHSVFHLFCLGGTICHMMTVWYIL